METHVFRNRLVLGLSDTDLQFTEYTIVDDTMYINAYHILRYTMMVSMRNTMDTIISITAMISITVRKVVYLSLTS